LEGHSDSARRVAFFPYGRRLLSASHYGTMIIWDVESGKEPPVVTGFKGRQVWGISFSPDGLRVAATGGSYVQIWDTCTREPIAALLEVPSGGFHMTAFSRDGSRVAADAGGGTVRVWGSVSGKVVFES
ncbi:hypothetical protein HYDPIDRAFT_103283, partial [Hydnomerulius pinastri MD-312]